MSSLKIKLLSAIVVGSLAGYSLAYGAASDERWVPGRLLVKPKPGLSDAEFNNILKGHSAKSIGKISGIDVHVVQLPANMSEKAVAALLAKNPHIKFAERDMILKPQATSNDPYFGSEWHLTQINVPAAWDISLGSGIVIAILDSGVDLTHPDLAGKVVSGWNFYDNNSTVTDVYGHGTIVAGSAAAIANNGVGVAGVAGAAQIMPIRVTDASGSGYISYMASGITWAADHGAKVANLSFEAAGIYSTIQSAAQYMKNKNGLVVTAAGNSGSQLTNTYSDTNVVVSATDSADAKASWSNYGDFVSVAAPGVGIYTTANGGGYTSASGTSVASPVVAGVVALMFGSNPSLAASDVQKILFSTALDLGAAGKDVYYGYGRIDAGKAVATAKTSVSLDSVAPTVAISSPTAGSAAKGIVSVSVSASDNVGVSRVDLAVNGVVIGSDTLSPYSFSWDSTSVADGSVGLTAYAYDAAGNYSKNSVSVTVANTTDTTPPVAKVTNPVSGATVSGTVTIGGSATDNVAVSTTEILIDGKSVAKVSGGSASYSWNTRKVSAGSHTIRVRATDISGNVGVTDVVVTK